MPVFPLAGALLFPRAQLPLHIFEPRYRAMVRDALASDRLIAMVQPKDEDEPPALFEIGCLGRIGACEELDDGRFNIVLEGLSRFRIAREAVVDTLYRQVDADRSGFHEDEDAVLAMVQRAEVEREARRYADALGYMVEWESVSRLDDEMLVNGIAQIAPLRRRLQAGLARSERPRRPRRPARPVHAVPAHGPGGADGPETLQ